MEPLELGEGGKTHVLSVMLLNTFKTEGLELGFDVGGELSRQRFRREEGCPGGDGTWCG